MIHTGFGRGRARKLERSCSQVRPTARQPPHHRPLNGTPSTASVPHELTLIVMGAEKVGKSALVSQFLWNTFIPEYRPTVEEFHWIEYELAESGELLLQVIDTSGSRDFIAMRSLYTRTGDAFMVVHDVNDGESLLEAKRIVQEIRDQNKRNAPIVLVGTKLDRTTMDFTPRALHDFATNAQLPFVCLSAKDTQTVNSTFGELIDRLKAHRIAGEHQLRKRRQSMPTRRATGSSALEIDVGELQRIANRHSRKDNCTVS